MATPLHYYAIFIMVCASLSLIGSIWVMCFSPRNAMLKVFSILWTLAFVDFLMSIFILLVSSGLMFFKWKLSNLGWMPAIFHFLTCQFAVLGLAISCISFYIVKLNGSLKKINWELLSFLTFLPAALGTMLYCITMNDPFMVDLRVPIVVQFQLIMVVFVFLTMFAIYAITFEELRIQQRFRLQKYGEVEFKRLENLKHKGTQLMLRLITAFSIIDFIVWIPYILYLFRYFVSEQAFIRRQFKVESPELFFLVVNVAFQISFSLKGFFHAIGIYYIHGLKKRERRIAKPNNNVTESLEMTETIDDTDDTDVSEDSMVNHLSMMGVIVPLHVKIGLKRNRSKGMKAKQSEHFESTFDESGTVDDDGSLVLNESYIVTHRSPDYTLDESSVLPQTTK